MKKLILVSIAALSLFADIKLVQNKHHTLTHQWFSSAIAQDASQGDDDTSGDNSEGGGVEVIEVIGIRPDDGEGDGGGGGGLNLDLGGGSDGGGPIGPGGGSTGSGGESTGEGEGESEERTACFALAKHDHETICNTTAFHSYLDFFATCPVDDFSFSDPCFEEAEEHQSALLQDCTNRREVDDAACERNFPT